MSEKRYVRMPRKAFLSLMRLAWQNAGQTASGNYKWVDDTGTQKPRYTKSDKPPQSRSEKQQQQATAKAERQKQKEAARQAKEQEKAAKSPEAKKARAQEAIQNAIENGVQGEQVLALVDVLLSVRVKDLKEIRASLGAKGGKTKSEITKKISAKIVEKALGEQKPKAEPPPKASPQPAAESAKIQSTVMDFIKGVQVESLADLRDKMPEGMSGKEFDDAILKLADEGKVKLSADDTPESRTPEEKEKAVKEGDNFFNYIIPIPDRQQAEQKPKAASKAKVEAKPKAEKAVEAYKNLRDSIKVPVDFDRIRNDFDKITAGLSKSEMASLAEAIGFASGGMSKEKMKRQLLASLEGIATSKDQVSRIGEPPAPESKASPEEKAKAPKRNLDKLKGMAQKADEAHRGGAPLDDFEVQIYANQAASMMKDMSDREAIDLAKAFGVVHNLKNKADAIKRVKEKVLEGPRTREKIRY